MKKILLILFILPMLVNAQQAQVSGVVTYFFNQYQGDKPDLGSKVYLIDKNEYSQYLKILDSFNNVRTYKILVDLSTITYNNYMVIVNKYEGKKRFKAEYDVALSKATEAKKGMEPYQLILKNYNVDTKESFDAFDLRCQKSLSLLKTFNHQTKTVDGSGNYSFNCKPGNYFVLIISKNRTSITYTEIMGKIFTKDLDAVKEGSTIDVSYNFDQH